MSYILCSFLYNSVFFFICNYLNLNTNNDIKNQRFSFIFCVFFLFSLFLLFKINLFKYLLGYDFISLDLVFFKPLLND